MDFRENLQKCRDYIEALELERQKILVFQRELPLCLELVTKTLEAYKQQLLETATGTATAGAQSEYSEQTTTSDRPVLEEFMPIKATSSTEAEEVEVEESESRRRRSEKNDEGGENGKNSDWLSSAQLWNQTTDSSPENRPRKVAVVEVKNNGSGAFQPFQKDRTAAKITVEAPVAVAPAASSCSTAERVEEEGSGSATKKDNEKGEQSSSHRKARRCWSPELHRRFINALQQLGGSHVATPKQIRESMKVDGLTNDEVKSHLQKYRLHTRRPASASNANPQAPQFVVVGGIWVPPPPEYATGATLGGEPAGTAPLYAPVTAPPPHSQSSPVGNQSTTCDDRGSQLSDGGHVHTSKSSSTSSSA
ncbi:Transcription factor HHO3-like protein [Drosera capensis]